MAADGQPDYIQLYKASLVPLYTCFVGLVWIFHDYFITLEDEIRLIWPQKWTFGKIMFCWIRYYSLALLVFDVTQIHLFTRAGVASDVACVAMDPITRLAGAISLWLIEIIMQIRIYALYRSSRKIALFNGTIFLCTVAAFIYVLWYNANQRHALIAFAEHLRLPGCPSLHSGSEWLLWVPATGFEVLLFGLALFKALRSTTGRTLKNIKVSLYELVLRDNLLYFFTIGILLIFNNLMVVGVTRIPWFSFSPFHAAMGILTTRMFLNTHEALAADVDLSQIVREALVLNRDDPATENIPGHIPGPSTENIPGPSRLAHSQLQGAEQV